METQRRKQHNFTENNMWALLWHGLPVAALLLWGAFCITNSLWYDEPRMITHRFTMCC